MVHALIIYVVSVFCLGFYLGQLWRRLTANPESNIPDSKFKIRKAAPGPDAPAPL